MGPNNETERPEILGSPRGENQNIGKLAKTGSERGRLVISRVDAFYFEASLARRKGKRATNFREAKRVRETIRHHLYARVSPRASLLSTAELVNIEIWRGIYPCTPDAILHKNNQLDHGQILYLSPFTNNN